jgi:hypothetical protein
MDWAQNAPQSSVHTTRPHQFYKNNKCFYFNYLGKWNSFVSRGKARKRGRRRANGCSHFFDQKKQEKRNIRWAAHQKMIILIPLIAVSAALMIDEESIS